MLKQAELGRGWRFIRFLRRCFPDDMALQLILLRRLREQ